MEYLKLPLRFEHFFEGQSLPTCNMEGSVMRFLHLLLTTVQEEYELDSHFGLGFWDDDFTTHLNLEVRKEQMVKQIKLLIAQYELRLVDVQVQVNIKADRKKQVPHPTERRRVEISITGNLAYSMAPLSFHTAFYIGPLDFD